jgi:hypothetical protein
MAIGLARIDLHQYEETRFWLKRKHSRLLEVIMQKEILKENKARWMLFEQVSPTTSALMWAALGVVVALGILYIFYLR